jgi:hypothetical protein
MVDVGGHMGVFAVFPNTILRSTAESTLPEVTRGDGWTVVPAVHGGQRGNHQMIVDPMA